MHIFFHLHDGLKLIHDPEGGTFESMPEAHAQAVRSAREMMADGFKAGQSLFHYAIHATDEDGGLHFCLSFRDAVPK